MKNFVISAILMLVCSTSFAQGPNDSGTYYQAADGKKGAELKTALCGIITENHKSLSYDDLWGYFEITDLRTDGKIWDVYSDITNYDVVYKGQSSYPNEGSGYNKEHSFPNSWFGGVKNSIMYSDLFHLYPTDAYINNMRSNYAFGETQGSKKSQTGFSKLGSCTYPGYTGTVFEPNDIYKGDFARTYFYMVTRYENEIPEWYNNYKSKEGVSQTLDGNKYPGLSTWQLNMLMEWSKNDPVDNPVVKETPRNKAVYGIQKNRNPFIDYPGLERFIWGDLKDMAFSYDHYTTTGIEDLIEDVKNDEPEAIYSPDGRRLQRLQRGLNIVRTKSRRTIKVLVK
jgi:endonuclease I